jgi:PPM family protein phosphatase
MDDRRTIPPIVPETLHDGVQVVAMSDVGCVREENQDFMGWFSVEGAQLLVVADGMGGHSGGFEASRIAVDKIRQTFVELGASEASVPLLTEAIRRANAGVREVAAAAAAMRGMGTTVVMALVRDGQAWLGHVGDSRCYLVREGRATLLTMDHSRVNRMVAAGLLTAEAAEDHPMGHILERSVGADDHVEAEVTGKPLQLVVGDRLVLCSDGLWGLVKGPEIGELFTGRDLRASVEAAIQLALDRGADDNTTVGSLEVVEGLGLGATGSPPGADETRRVPTTPGTEQLPELSDPGSRPAAADAAATGIGFLVLVGLLTAVAVVLIAVGWRLLGTDGGTATPAGSAVEQEDEGAATPEVTIDPLEGSKVKQGATAPRPGATTSPAPGAEPAATAAPPVKPAPSPVPVDGAVPQKPAPVVSDEPSSPEPVSNDEPAVSPTPTPTLGDQPE